MLPLCSLPCPEDCQNLFFVVSVEFFASSGSADIGIRAPLRCGILPDVVAQAPVDEVDAAAVEDMLEE